MSSKLLRPVCIPAATQHATASSRNRTVYGESSVEPAESQSRPSHPPKCLAPPIWLRFLLGHKEHEPIQDSKRRLNERRMSTSIPGDTWQLARYWEHRDST